MLTMSRIIFLVVFDGLLFAPVIIILAVDWTLEFLNQSINQPSHPSPRGNLEHITYDWVRNRISFLVGPSDFSQGFPAEKTEKTLR